MGECGAVATFAVWKRRKKFSDAIAEVDGQAENRAELDDDGEHLPVTVVEIDSEQSFGNAQMSGGADGDEFSQAFDHAEDECDHVRVHELGSYSLELPVTGMFC